MATHTISANESIPTSSQGLRIVFESNDFLEGIEDRWRGSFICSDVAAMIYSIVGSERTQILGFSVEANPSAAFFAQSPEDDEDGHHFALVDGRFIIDPWIYALAGRSVIDIEARDDAALIKNYYGDQRCWARLTSEEHYAKQWWKSFPEVASFVTEHVSYNQHTDAKLS